MMSRKVMRDMGVTHTALTCEDKAILQGRAACTGSGFPQSQGNVIYLTSPFGR